MLSGAIRPKLGLASLFIITYTQSLPKKGPYPEFALRGTSSSTVHISTDTHFLYLQFITAFSPTVYASVECDNGIGRALFGSTTSREVCVLVPAERSAVCCILLYAFLSSRVLFKQTS